MERIKQVVSEIGELDAEAMRRARERQDQLTKPQGSLGVLEELSIKIAGITGKAVPEVGDKAIIVMAADHGVVEEGVSAYPREVTPQMVLNFAHGGAGINVLARHVGARVIVVDVGVAQKIEYQERAPSEVEGFSTSLSRAKSRDSNSKDGCNILRASPSTPLRINFASREAQGSSRQACLERGREARTISYFIDRKVRFGTDNMTKGPAMSREEAIASIEVGIDIVEEEIKRGVTIIGTGDMGIGNTTPSSAILSVFSRGKVPRLPGRRGGHPAPALPGRRGHSASALPVEASALPGRRGHSAPALSMEEVVGRGTGITDGQLETKIRVIKEALHVNRPDPGDPLDVLAKVGGLEIGGMAGCVLGAAAHRIPVVIDGFISSAAALIASRIAPKSVDYMIASHVSVEPGHKIILEMLGLEPMLHMDMRLGEGTGAALGISLAEAATRVLAEMATFEEAQVSTKRVEVDP